MKFTVTMKDPDVLQDAIDDAVKNIEIDGLSSVELNALRDARKEKISDICSKWFKYGEYLTVELDTDEASIKVLPS